MSCQKPGCGNSPSETYTGKHGNELDLCSKHYYELVSGKSVSEDILTPSVGTGVGTDLTSFDEPEGKGVLDGLNRDVPKGMTPCPDCGRPMGMVSWTGWKPQCIRCQRNTIGETWMGVLDPNSGEELGPTMETHQPLGSGQLYDNLDY